MLLQLRFSDAGSGIVDPKRVIDRSAKLPIYNNFKVIEAGKVPKSMFLRQGEPTSLLS